MQLVSSCMRHMQLKIRPVANDKLHEICSCMKFAVACDSRIIQVHTIGFYGFIHPYFILAIGRAITCNYRGCVHTALHVN